MKKMNFEEFRNEMIRFNEEKAFTTKGTQKKLIGKIVFKASNWPDKNYSEDELTYITTSDNKGFGLSGFSCSIFANCAAPYTDQGVRLDWYMKPYEPNGWEVDYCVICGEE